MDEGGGPTLEEREAAILKLHHHAIQRALHDFNVQQLQNHRLDGRACGKSGVRETITRTLETQVHWALAIPPGPKHVRPETVFARVRR